MQRVLSLTLRIALGVSYRGSGYQGWQSQPSGLSVQDALERALSQVADAPVRVVAAGRTDAGVHATGQVVHFDTAAVRPSSAWVRGTNAHLPSGVVVSWSRPMDETFHARFSACARTYQYLLYNDPVRPALLADLSGWFHRPLDVTAMREAARPLLGRHDFSSFRSSQCQARSPEREVTSLAIDIDGPYLIFTISANAFLHHMVRNIVGALVDVGAGRMQAAAMTDLLAARDRRTAPPTFSPAGLCLAQVRYPQPFSIPEPVRLPWS